MIVQERYQNDPGGWVLVRTYSNSGMMISQDETGDLYSEAIDPEWTYRTYTETEIPISDYDPDEGEPVEPDYDNLVADRSYEIGEYLTLYGSVYRVILPIQKGGRITMGTNVEKTTILAELANLNQEVS